MYIENRVYVIRNCPVLLMMMMISFPICLINIQLDGFPGVADIIGRRYGSMKIPYNQKKSWAGSISMLVFGFLVSIGCVTIQTLFQHKLFLLLIGKLTSLISFDLIFLSLADFDTETFAAVCM